MMEIASFIVMCGMAAMCIAVAVFVVVIATIEIRDSNSRRKPVELRNTQPEKVAGKNPPAPTERRPDPHTLYQPPQCQHEIDPFSMLTTEPPKYQCTICGEWLPCSDVKLFCEEHGHTRQSFVEHDCRTTKTTSRCLICGDTTFATTTRGCST